MKKEDVIRKLLGIINRQVLERRLGELAVKQEKNDVVQLADASMGLSNDKRQIWFTGLAVLCYFEKAMAIKLLRDSASSSGNPITEAVAKELIDATAAGAKLTKADAG